MSPVGSQCVVCLTNLLFKMGAHLNVNSLGAVNALEAEAPVCADRMNELMPSVRKVKTLECSKMVWGHVSEALPQSNMCLGINTKTYKPQV